MLRPSASLLASSKVARRQALWHARVRVVGQVARGVRLAALDVAGTVVDLAVLVSLPLAYLAAAYLVLDLPGRLLAGKVHFTGLGFLAFLAAGAVSLCGVWRAIRGEPPVAPVRPEFAKAMLLVGWAVALLLTVVDLAG